MSTTSTRAFLSSPALRLLKVINLDTLLPILLISVVSPALRLLRASS
jgi:hypothetical protein